jgi:hypothetical protein
MRLLGCAASAFEEQAVDPADEPWLDEMDRGTEEMIRRAIGKEVLAAARDDGRKLTVDEAVALALAALR